MGDSVQCDTGLFGDGSRYLALVNVADKGDVNMGETDTYIEYSDDEEILIEGSCPKCGGWLTKILDRLYGCGYCHSVWYVDE